MAYKSPPKGYVINDADYGTIFIGEDEGVERKRQMELHATSNACIKLFKDGGFEIQSSPSATIGDNILSQSKNGLFVKGKNIHLDAGNGEITLSARSIRFESTGNDQNLVVRSNGNIQLEAADTIKLDSSVVAVGAKTRMLLHSKGPIYINSKAGVSIVEPKISLTPTNLLQSVQSMVNNFF